MSNEEETPAAVWAILELMGHVKTGALISKDTQFGTALLRAEVPQKDGSFVTQLVNPASLYRVTICEEKLARACADACSSKPMSAFEVRHLMPPTEPVPPPHYPDPDYDEGSIF
jgi:hypothetical protein